MWARGLAVDLAHLAGVAKVAYLDAGPVWAEASGEAAGVLGASVGVEPLGEAVGAAGVEPLG